MGYTSFWMKYFECYQHFFHSLYSLRSLVAFKDNPLLVMCNNL